MSEKEQATIRKLAEQMKDMNDQQRDALLIYSTGLADGVRIAKAERCEAKG